MLYQWKGIPRNREGVSVYSSFRRTEKTTGKVREFIVGDIVEVKSTGKGLGMVAQVVKFFQESDALTDVSDMRLSLRWLYRKKDFHHSMLRKAMGVMEERDNQVFFSDFLEEPGSNSIEVIENLVFLFQTETQRSDHVSQFTLGIKTRFIRPDPKLFIDCFFHHRYKLIRKLMPGELGKMLKHPSATDHYLVYEYNPRLMVAMKSARRSTAPQVEEKKKTDEDLDEAADHPVSSRNTKKRGKCGGFVSDSDGGWASDSSSEPDVNVSKDQDFMPTIARQRKATVNKGGRSDGGKRVTQVKSKKNWGANTSERHRVQGGHKACRSIPNDDTENGRTGGATRLDDDANNKTGPQVAKDGVRGAKRPMSDDFPSRHVSGHRRGLRATNSNRLAVKTPQDVYSGSSGATRM